MTMTIYAENLKAMAERVRAEASQSAHGSVTWAQQRGYIAALEDIIAAEEHGVTLDRARSDRQLRARTGQ
jgi:hypothetical protein